MTYSVLFFCILVDPLPCREQNFCVRSLSGLMRAGWLFWSFAEKKHARKVARDPAETPLQSTAWTSKMCEAVSINDMIKDMQRTSTYLVLKLD